MTDYNKTINQGNNNNAEYVCMAIMQNIQFNKTKHTNTADFTIKIQ